MAWQHNAAQRKLALNAVVDEKPVEKKSKSLLRDTQSRLFPQLSLAYFVLSLGMLVVFAAVLDRLIIPALEDQGKIVSQSWDEEDQFIYYWAHARNMSELNHNPVWHSKHWPVSEKSPRSHRILVLGDSFIWGHGYNNMNDIWWRQLARELTRRGYKDVEVIAAGMQGINTRLELDVAKKVIPKFKPDLVIWGYIPNDADEMSRLENKDFEQKLLFRPHRQNGILEALKGLFPHLSHQLIALHDAYLRKTRTGEFSEENPPNWEAGLLTGENWSMYSKTIDRTADYLNSLSIPSFFLLLPYECPGKLDFDQIKAHYDRVFPKVVKTFQDRKVRVENSYDTWIKAAQGEDNLSKKGVLWFGVNPANAHPNRFSTYAYATHAANILEKDFPQILGAKKTEKAISAININDTIPPDLQFQPGGDNKFVIVYPFSADDFRFMPLRKPFIELNLELPVDAKEISLGGNGLKGASVYVTNVDAAKHFDDGEMFALGQKKGSWLKWKLPESRQKGINTLNISANVVGADRALILEIIK